MHSDSLAALKRSLRAAATHDGRKVGRNSPLFVLAGDAGAALRRLPHGHHGAARARAPQRDRQLLRHQGRGRRVRGRAAACHALGEPQPARQQRRAHLRARRRHAIRRGHDHGALRGRTRITACNADRVEAEPFFSYQDHHMLLRTPAGALRGDGWRGEAQRRLRRARARALRPRARRGERQALPHVRGARGGAAAPDGPPGPKPVSRPGLCSARALKTATGRAYVCVALSRLHADF